MIHTASPGRIEFIGNHTDYNGGKVLGVALNLKIDVVTLPRQDQKLIFSSKGMDAVYQGDLSSIEKQTGDLAWANYPLGVLQVLREAGHELVHGVEMTFSSDLPTGAGLSSSAAIELSTLESLCRVMGVELTRKEKVLLAQKAENEFVGVPCGMLDQAVSCFGKVDHLVRIDCSITDFKAVPMPEGLHFWVFNTNHKHSLVDSMYATRHAECREALTELQKELPGLEYLVHAPLDSLQVLGEGSNIYRRARHIIEENARVDSCISALADGDLDTVGELLFASHASSRDLFENSIPELNTFVEILSTMRENGVIGARLSGGGFGGAVMALTSAEFNERDADKVIESYRLKHPGSEEPRCIHVMTGDGTRSL